MNFVRTPQNSCLESFEEKNEDKEEKIDETRSYIDIVLGVIQEAINDSLARGTGSENEQIASGRSITDTV